jgi:hypothetical protein
MYQDEQLELLQQQRLMSPPDQLIVICQGKPRCQEEDDQCEMCLIVESGDKRSSEQIIKEMRWNH